MAEHEYRTISVDAIASEAKVGKQSIYRWWDSKADLVLEAFTEHSVKQMPPLVATSNAFLDLEKDLARFFTFMRDGLVAKGMRSLIAEAQLNVGFKRDMYECVHRVRCEALRRIFRHGYALGQFRQGLDEDALAHIIHGAFWYRFLSGAKYPLNDEYAKTIVELLRPIMNAPAEGSKR